jgi:hypothetical protein
MGEYISYKIQNWGRWAPIFFIPLVFLLHSFALFHRLIRE